METPYKPLVIKPKGRHAYLIGDISESLELSLQDRFMWVDASDLTNEVYFYADKCMYRGFADPVCQYINDYGIPCTVELPKPSRTHTWEFKWTYRPFQEEAVEHWLEYQNGIVSAPPGFGKTVCIAATIASAGVSAAVLVQSKEPFNQAYTTITGATTVPSVGRIGTGLRDIQDVSVVMIQTLVAELKNNPDGPVAKWWRSVKMVIVDEVHHAAANSYLIALGQLEEVEYLLGTSATPLREDGKAYFLTSYCGPVIYERTFGDMVEVGSLCPMSVFIEQGPPYTDSLGELAKTFLPLEDMSEELDPTFMELYKSYIVDNDERNMIGINFAREAVENGLSVALIVSRTTHADALCALMPELVQVTANNSNAERIRIWSDFKDQKIMCVVSTLLDEAVDIPTLGAVVLMAGGKTYTKLFQRLRSQRTFDGKTSRGRMVKDRGYVMYIADKAPILKDHSSRCIAYLTDLVKQHADNVIEHL